MVGWLICCRTRKLPSDDVEISSRRLRTERTRSGWARVLRPCSAAATRSWRLQSEWRADSQSLAGRRLTRPVRRARLSWDSSVSCDREILSRARLGSSQAASTESSWPSLKSDILRVVRARPRHPSLVRGWRELQDRVVVARILPMVSTQLTMLSVHLVLHRLANTRAVSASTSVTREEGLLSSMEESLELQLEKMVLQVAGGSEEGESLLRTTSSPRQEVSRNSGMLVSSSPVLSASSVSSR